MSSSECSSGGFNLYFYTTILFAVASTVTLIMYNLKTCPPSKLIATKKLVGVTNESIPTIDLQFSETNFPSVVYDDIFTGNNVWLGGYNGTMNTGKGTTSTTQNGLSTPPVLPISGYVRGG